MTRRRKLDEAGRVFSEAMRGVERLDDTPRRQPTRRRRVPVREDSTGPRYEVSTVGPCHHGRREDVSEADLEALREGRVDVANRLDMHGMSEEAARDRILWFVRQAVQSGLKCVAVVHGRGLRSPDGPILKEALPRWLTQLPLARDVAAFSSAPRHLGGDGVTLVLLRR